MSLDDVQSLICLTQTHICFSKCISLVITADLGQDDRLFIVWDACKYV